MIRQISDQIFSFSFHEIPAQCKWGDDPHLDQLGVVSHLLSSFEIVDKEQYNWIKEHKMPIEFVKSFNTFNKVNKSKHLHFDKIEDAMAFKLRWL